MRGIKGFSISELLTVIIVISILIVMISQAFKGSKEEAQIMATQNKIKLIMEALENYRRKFNHYPCPSRPSSAVNDVDNGIASSNCFLTCPIDQLCNDISVVGSVPYVSLGLNKVTTIDEWDAKISYTIDRRFTQNGPCEIKGNIIIQHLAGSSITENINQAHYVVLSHGKNGKGAYRENGSLINNCGHIAEEDTNNCTNNSFFVNGNINLDSNSTEYFDDIIAWNTNPYIKNCPSGIPGCSLWLDAADVCTIDYMPGSPNVVTKWLDKSTNAYIATPSNGSIGASFSPLSKQNNSRYFSFNNSGFYLSNSPPNPIVPLTSYTHIIVFRTLSTNSTLLSGVTNTSSPLSNSDRKITLDDNSKITFNLTGNKSIRSNISCGNINPYCADYLSRIVTVTVDKALGQKLYINGITDGVDNVNTAEENLTNYFQVGFYSDSPSSGDIFEVIVYDRVLSKKEIKAVELYLADKWGIISYSS